MLASFIAIVFLGSASLINWFEAPRGSLMGEPVTFILIVPQEEHRQPTAKDEIVSGISIGSFNSEPQISRQDHRSGGSADDGEEVPKADVVPASSGLVPHPVMVRQTTVTTATTPEENARSSSSSLVDGAEPSVGDQATSPAQTIAALPEASARGQPESAIPQKPDNPPEPKESAVQGSDTAPVHTPLVNIALPVRAPKFGAAADDTGSGSGTDGPAINSGDIPATTTSVEENNRAF